MKKSILLPLLVLITLPAVHAQKRKLVDRREQAEGWYVPVRGEVLADGKPVRDYQVELWKGDERVGQVAVDKKGGFNLDLDIDQSFLVRVTKEGFEDKLVLIETALPPDLVTYPDYICYVNLIPRGKTAGIDPFYADFPSAIVRWNSEMGGFYHSERYLEHIQTKLAGHAQASF
ncbi:MAG: hypothetical protein IT228_06960 [Flavobacteriales bacterium]|nr:hypothetical protein [Flavobacteriales bacterium]MCC6577067.1 hypothetical protein [Flavobacteriales bacterium]NUQ15430.1 hypothetical protein [Flavobacteriales bacterium]